MGTSRSVPWLLWFPGASSHGVFGQPSIHDLAYVNSSIAYVNYVVNTEPITTLLLLPD